MQLNKYLWKKIYKYDPIYGRKYSRDEQNLYDCDIIVIAKTRYNIKWFTIVLLDENNEAKDVLYESVEKS